MGTIIPWEHGKHMVKHGLKKTWEHPSWENMEDWMGIELTTELIAPSLQGTTPLEEFGDDLFELLPFYNAATRHSRCFCCCLIMV